VLCREENDPLLHPHVQDHIQRPLKKIPFSEWVEKATMINKFFRSEAVWPFGLSREVPDGAVEVEKLFHPTDKNDDSASNGGSPIASKSSQLLDDIPDPFLMGAWAMAKATMLGGTDMNDRDRRILEGVDGALTAAMIFSSNKRKRLPCWVLIKLHTRASTEAGLLAVHVAGHNQEPLSQLTIVAADGGNANAPLKGISTKRQIDQVVSEIKSGVNVLIPVPTGKSLAPWENRAWTLQEKLLSNRLIVFSGGHMIWHCRKVVHFEDMTAKDAVAILGSTWGILY
jgi:hypothetical protein